MRRAVVRGAFAVACVGMAASMSGCSLQQDVNPAGGHAAPTQAPPIAASTLSGGKFDLASARGHPVVIDFWGSWCAPCRAEQHDINSVVSTYQPRGVVFIGVLLRDTPASARAYEHDLGVAYTSIDDSDERIAADYNVAAPPALVVVDQSGRIIDRLLGTVVGLRDDLDRLLKS